MNLLQQQVLHQKVKTKFILIISYLSFFCKGTFFNDPRITLENDEITLDFDIMKRSIKSLMLYEDEISSTMNNAFAVLFKQIYNELTSTKKSELENDAHFLNIFFIFITHSTHKRLGYINSMIFCKYILIIIKCNFS